MAPISTATSEADDRIDSSEEEIVLENQTKDFDQEIYGLIDITDGNVCRRRNSSAEDHQMNGTSCSRELSFGGRETPENECYNRSINMSGTCTENQSNNMCSCGEKDNKTNNCDECAKTQNQTQTRVYHKQEKDGFVKNASIRKALYKMSPTWVKAFINDPEYVMTGVKRKNSDVIHHQADSLFSTSSGFNNYRGLLNLCIILLVLSNARLFLENIIKYGILIDPFLLARIAWNQPFSGSNIALVLGCNVFILLMFYTEKAIERSWLSETLALLVQSVNLVLMLTIPAAVVLYLHPNPLISTTVLGIYTVIFLKLVSYASVNKWCRQAQSPKRRGIKRSKSVCVSNGGSISDEEEHAMVVYPENLNYTDLYYFMLAPTLCYELNFPRSLRIRKRFLLKRIVEMLFIIQLIMGCIQQWILPLVHNSLKPLADMDAARVVERLLKLAIPNHFIWLMFFYWFFHSCLNVLAELLKFGDREFYKDWWNSDTVNQFWSYWNIPVHRWASRHLYKPLLKRGYNRLHASVAVFFVSAFFHEYLLSVPLQMFRLWAFMGMLGQVPLALIQTKYIHGKFGNMVVWLSLILGQPIAVLAYFHDYYIMHIATQDPTTV